MNLKDTILSDFLNENGFCKLDLKAKSILAELQDLYNKYYTDLTSEKKFFVTHNKEDDFDRTISVHQQISKICRPVLDECFEEFEIFAAHFVVKKAHGENGLQLHQDWNNVDERHTHSLQVWIPLTLSYPENGGLGFFPKSHTFFNNFRSGSFGITHVDLEQKLYDYLSYLRLFPGESAIFYNNTFHCSFINSTSEDRIAVLLNIIPKNVETAYCHKNNDILEKYELNTISLFQNLHALEKGILPDNFKLISSELYTQVENSTINADSLIKKISEINNKNGHSDNYEVKCYSIIKDVELESKLNHEGYSIIQFLTENEINQIQEVFKRFFPDRNIYNGSYNSLEHLSSEDTLKAHQQIQRIIAPRIELFFKDAYSPVSLLYSKKPDGVLDIDWHSDPSFIMNEHLEPIYGIWCSLYDIGRKEGSLMIVPGSHRFVKRLHKTSMTLKSPIEDYLRVFDKFGVQPKLKAGQAVMFDTRIIHSSTPNSSEIDRDCIVLRVTNKRTKDFVNINMDPHSSLKGNIKRESEDYFYQNSVKGKLCVNEVDSSEGEMQFFYYPMDERTINEYFKKFIT